MGAVHIYLAALLATGASACQVDFNVEKRHSHRPRVSKRNDNGPPVLSEHETILVNSFDNVTIDEWAHYYGNMPCSLSAHPRDTANNTLQDTRTNSPGTGRRPQSGPMTASTRTALTVA